jgi:hypothetical protein
MQGFDTVTMINRLAVWVFFYWSLSCSGAPMLQNEVSCNANHPGGESLLQHSRRQIRNGFSLAKKSTVDSGMSGLNSTKVMAMPEVPAHIGAMATHLTPKVLRSMYDKTTLFYHVHIPKTGGTTVANLLVADVCAPEAASVESIGWESRCGRTCEMGLTDNELSCANALRNNVEHNRFDVNFWRAEKLRQQSGAQRTVFVTTLRRGHDRVISQWSAELGFGTYIPPAGVPPWSGQSLMAYIQGRGSGRGWIARHNHLVRNNLQVAQLASAINDNHGPVTRAHLEKAKQVLTRGPWIIGFTHCMPQMHEKLMRYASSLHKQYYRPKTLPHHVSEHGKISLNAQEVAALNAASALDNELADWAWNMAKTSGDLRWASTC